MLDAHTEPVISYYKTCIPYRMIPLALLPEPVSLLWTVLSHHL